jgi:hypothetical protein
MEALCSSEIIPYFRDIFLSWMNARNVLIRLGGWLYLLATSFLKAGYLPEKISFCKSGTWPDVPEKPPR